ncbi:hypothetical protein TNCV_3593721 [Trichonephila clavipes]|nr:hypothetical protein TNCV_3593721 [Trichonephila clavipes]
MMNFVGLDLRQSKSGSIRSNNNLSIDYILSRQCIPSHCGRGSRKVSNSNVVGSRVRVLVPLKTHHVEWLMHVKSVRLKVLPLAWCIVRVQYFVRGGFVDHRSRASSKHLSPHLPVDELDSSGVKKGLRCRCKMHVWVSGPTKDAD